MSQLADATAYFDKMPQEVIDAWFAEFVEARGWPPDHPHWKLLLRGYNPDQWREFTWSKERVELTAVRFNDKAENLLIGLANATMAGQISRFSGVENSLARMKSILTHLLQTGDVPGFLILLHDRNDEWDVIDGSHRTAGYLACSKLPETKDRLNKEQWAWVARPPHEALIPAS